MIRKISVAALVFLAVCAAGSDTAVCADPLRATAVAERKDVFIGEPFIFQIRVSGSEHPERPDVSNIKDFSVTFQGGQQNSRRSVTIINGRVTRNVQEGYVFSYRLTPKRMGRVVIPAITISAGGQSVRTEPVIITVRKPVETDDFKLRLSLSKGHCYVGEAVTVTVTWYIGKDVRDFSFTLPLLDNDAFDFADPRIDKRPGRKLYRIPLGGGTVIGVKGKGSLGGRDYATITFRKILIPKRSGDFRFDPATVCCSALSGFERSRGMFDDDFFSNFFNSDFFGQGRRGIYRTVVVPSNSLRLRVSDLPSEGRPANFAGHVGEYHIRDSATPTDVNVGDPITLTITLSGPDYLENVKLPPLRQDPRFTKNFKIPSERASGEISGRSKIFTQTIRALRPDVREIPAIELPFFDPRAGKYRIARTKPIPLHVRQTRVVTALDAEGRSDEQTAGGSEIETWTEGIAFNYDDATVLENQRLEPSSWFQTPLWFCLLVGPPAVCLLLLAGTTLVRRRKADPLKTRARKAYGALVRSLKAARHASSGGDSCDLILRGFQSYLGNRLRVSTGALTFNDVRDKLAAEDIDPGVLERLRILFEKCEAGRYAGTLGISDAVSLAEEAILLAKDLEKKLK